MTTPDGRLVIRSYRSVFRFERRLYRFDRWRLPVRGGVPLRALLYAPAIYLALVVLSRLPVIGWALGALPDPLRWGLVPLGLVVVLLRVDVDGRPAHRVLWALLRWRLAARWTAGVRSGAPPGVAPLAVGILVVRPDWRGVGAKCGEIRGPARVRVARVRRVRGAHGGRGPASRAARRLVVELADEDEHGGGGRVIEIPPGGVLELR